MPLFKLETSAELTEKKQADLLKALSKIISEEIGKPETYVMGSVTQSAMMMSGSREPAAFADVRSIGGLTRDVNRMIADRICSLLQKELSLEPDRVYLNFTEFTRENWGWNSGTFG